MDALTVSPKELQAAGAELSSAGTAMYRYLTEMMEQVTALNAVWQGDASCAYAAKCKALQGSIDQLNRLVQNHAKDLQNVATNYSRTEQSNTAALEGLKSDVIK